MRTLTRATLVAGATLLLLPSLVLGHAQLLSSTPAAGAVLAVLPPAITLTYDDDLTSVSSFEVVGPFGSTVATGAVDPADPKTMSAAMPSLTDGAYEVRWTAGTSDGHIERGTFSFSVQLATAEPSAAAPSGAASTAPSTDNPSGAPTNTATAGPSATPSGDGPSPGGGSDVVIAVVAAVVIVVGGLAFILRRRGS